MISSKNHASSPTSNCTFQLLPLCLSGVFWRSLRGTEQKSPFYRGSLIPWYLHRQVADMCSEEGGIYHRLGCRHKSLPLNTKIYCRGSNFHPNWESVSVSCMFVYRSSEAESSHSIGWSDLQHTSSDFLVFLCHSENIFIKKRGERNSEIF